MMIQSTRFGTFEIDDRDVIQFQTGIIGFAGERRFAVIRHSDSIAFLQSLSTPELALPVVSAHVLAHAYPDVPVEPAAAQAGLGERLDELAVLAVLTALPGQPATVNLMAPVIVNVATRHGAQVFLDGTRFTTRELFVLPPAPEAAASKHQIPNEAAVG